MSAAMRVVVVALLWWSAPFLAATTAAAVPLADEQQAVGDVLRLADERLAVMPLVAAAKWPGHQPIADPAREEAVIAAAGERAFAMGLSRVGVEQFFRLQIRLAREQQERLTMHWNRDGYDSVQPYPDLVKDLRPRLDALTGRLLSALYLAVPALSRADATAALAGLVAATLPEARWSGADRADLLASLSAVRYARVGSLERARAAGLIRIGTPADYAPFSVAGPDGVAGADIELAQELAATLGLRPIFVRTSWATLLDDLVQDRVDLVVGGVSATPARLKVAGASVPLSRSGKTAIGRCSDRDSYASMADIDRATVTVVENPGGTNEAFARSHLKAAHVPGSTRSTCANGAR